MKKPPNYFSILAVAVLFFIGIPLKAQSTPAPATDATQADDQKQKEKEALEKKATALLEQIISELQMLKLPENRVRVQIAAGDLLWKRNEPRARSMFSLATDSVAELMRNTDSDARRSSSPLRQTLVIAAAQHDAQLAYQILATTRPPAPANSAENTGRLNSSDMLEQMLLSQIASLDPKFAAQKAEEALEKDQFPISLARVLAELQRTDKDAFNKLSERVVGRLVSANMLSSSDAGPLALSLLQLGPRTSDQTLPANGWVSGYGPILSSSAFPDLLNAVIDAAMKVTPQSATQRVANPRGGGGRGVTTVSRGDVQLTDAQIEQNNARRLLFGLQPLLAQVDQFVPGRATAVRQKLTEAGAGNNAQRPSMAQLNTLMQPTATADSLLQAAPSLPPQMQPRIYQQAAMKALDEGNADRARQIANEHLDERTRDSVLQKVDFQIMAKQMESDNMDQLRQALAQLKSDDDRIDLLLKMASLQSTDKAAAGKLLSEAQRFTNRHATSYRQFEQQLAVADAFANIDPARSFETVDPGISQLNELLSAAVVLSGFEVNMLRDGEMPLEGGNGLTSMVSRYGQELANLASKDFDRAESTANKFQMTEARLLARLAIVRTVLGGSPLLRGGAFFNGFPARRGP